MSPAVTAGLMWHPETWPMVWATVATVTPKHRAMRTYCACPHHLHPVYFKVSLKSYIYRPDLRNLRGGHHRLHLSSCQLQQIPWEKKYQNLIKINVFYHAFCRTSEAYSTNRNMAINTYVEVDQTMIFTKMRVPRSSATRALAVPTLSLEISSSPM